MTWAKLDDRWPRHPKAVSVGPLGRDLFVCGLCYCNEHLTDGFIPSSMLATLALSDPSAQARNGATAASAVARRLVAARLWEVAPGGWRVHDYHDWNNSADQVRAKRQAKRDRMDRWRSGASRDASRGWSGDAPRSASHDAPRDAAPTPTPTPTPQPPLSTRRVSSDSEVRYDWPSPQVKANSLRPDGTRWLPGRFPYEAFHHDCPDPKRRGACVRQDYADAHPGQYPVLASGAPKQCPHHRAPTVRAPRSPA